MKAMEARLVREELQKCYRGEGVNHLQNCKELADLYTRMIRENKVSLYIILDKDSEDIELIGYLDKGIRSCG